MYTYTHTFIYICDTEDWRLLKTYAATPEKDMVEEEDNDGLGDDLLTLENVDVESGDFVMVETDALLASDEEDEDGDDDAEEEKQRKKKKKKKRTHREWPRDVIQKKKLFFRDFEINSKVDAYDRENKWYAGTIVHIDRDDTTGAITEGTCHRCVFVHLNVLLVAIFSDVIISLFSLLFFLFISLFSLFFF